MVAQASVRAVQAHSEPWIHTYVASPSVITVYTYPVMLAVQRQQREERDLNPQCFYGIG